MRIPLRLDQSARFSRAEIPVLTVVVDNQHPRLRSSLVLLHGARDRVFLTVSVPSDVDLASFVIDSGHDWQSARVYAQNDLGVRVFSEMLLR